MFTEIDRKSKIIFCAAAAILLIIFLAGGVLWLRKDGKVSTSPTDSAIQMETERQGAPEIDLFTDSQNAPEAGNALPLENNPQQESAINSAPPPLLTSPPPPPPPVSMDRLKKQGCVADGLLTEYNPENYRFIDLINRSNCYYLHRAIETWLEPPDFEQIWNVMTQITKKDVVYGMFIAEAIDTKAEYYSDDKKERYDFSKMCRKGSDNIWGEHTCQPAFSSSEYRGYLKYTTRKAIDMGIQSFTFGQIYWQEGSENKYAQEIIRDIRAYAKKNGVDIVIGAQTGSITDPKYLQVFDYIEGGVGINGNGDIENGPCLSRRGSCWALLWNKAYAANAKNVLLHLDWTGILSDDLDIFARMSPEKRARTLRNLYGFFTAKNMGFLMPFFGVLDPSNGGCFGPQKIYYSPDNAYSCKDEGTINQILAQ